MVVFLIIGVMVLVGVISHTFGINTDPALLQVISGQAIDEIKPSNPITYESSVLILLIKGFLWKGILAQFAVMLLLSDASYLPAFTPDQLNALVMLFLDLSNMGILIAE